MYMYVYIYRYICDCTYKCTYMYIQYFIQKFGFNWMLQCFGNRAFRFWGFWRSKNPASIPSSDNPLSPLEQKPCCDTLRICAFAKDPETEGTTEMTLISWCKVIDSELMDMRSKHSRENAAYAAVEATSGLSVDARCHFCPAT